MSFSFVRGDTLSALISFALAVVASAFLLFVPMGSSESAGMTVTAPREGGGSVSRSERIQDGRIKVRDRITHASGRKELRRYTRSAPKTKPTTLLEEQPKEILRVVAVFLALTGLPLALNGTRFRTWARAIAAALLFVGSLISMSVGLFYMPSAVAMTVAAAGGERRE